ncbi:hypothetical protein ACRAWD_13880 [Caulobacter segnis]
MTLPADDPRLPAYLADFRTIARLTVDDANDTWGRLLVSVGLEQAARDPAD